jgi:hypothetical protein
MALFLSSLLIGAILPYRFNVLVLLPTIFAAWGFVFLTTVGFWWILLAMLLTAAGLQLGYLCGMAFLHVAGGRLSSVARAWLNRSAG